MEKRNQRSFLIISIVVTLAMVIILTVAGFAARDKSYTPSSWVLRSYGGNVALYNGEELYSVYGDIMLSNLPPEDIDILENGIAFPTKQEAEAAIEDYDG